MQLLRHTNFSGRIVLAWFVLCVGVAAAAPMIDPQGVQLVCPGNGGMKQLVLLEAPHVEGGIWQANGGLLAYAYPTYEGSSVSRDIPPTEQPLITEMAQRAVREHQPEFDVVRGSREALIGHRVRWGA